MDNKDLDGILYAGNKLYMNIPKTHEYLLATDVGNTVTDYGQRYNTEICKEMFGTFPEKLDTFVGIVICNTMH